MVSQTTPRCPPPRFFEPVWRACATVSGAGALVRSCALVLASRLHCLGRSFQLLAATETQRASLLAKAAYRAAPLADLVSLVTVRLTMMPPPPPPGLSNPDEFASVRPNRRIGANLEFHRHGAQLAPALGCACTLCQRHLKIRCAGVPLSDEKGILVLPGLHSVHPQPPPGRGAQL